MMLIPRMIPVTAAIPASGENAPGCGEQSDDGQNEQDNFHMPDFATSLDVAAMGCYQKKILVLPRNSGQRSKLVGHKFLERLVSARAKHGASGWKPATRSTGSPDIPCAPQLSGVPHDVHVPGNFECPNDRGFRGKYSRSWEAG